jgi:hypothetical protein
VPSHNLNFCDSSAQRRLIVYRRPELSVGQFSAIMGRKLKYHEQKLLKKVDFTTYKSDNDHRQAAVVRRYHIQKVRHASLHFR